MPPSRPGAAPSDVELRRRRSVEKMLRRLSAAPERNPPELPEEIGRRAPALSSSSPGLRKKCDASVA
ncbi:hypothetical protein EYF80_026006 [Liparis tanakae]|uniref:Uncharacterized protein n=1 Tax=Liparis tanakae TaxID=230148 RepID=A0A4Z2HFV8_9TELE|nr:hypothetical protein EYF80_026006 [Liparis tanakae]